MNHFVGNLSTKQGGRCQGQCDQVDNIFDQTKSKLQELNHTIDDEYFTTHILAGLPKEYASIVNQAKIDRRTSSLSLGELRKK